MGNLSSLGIRMKGYEGACSTTLSGRMPVIIRVDGKAFHTYTRGAKRPFDAGLIETMNDAALELCKQVQGAQLAYVQSDEISVLVHGYKKLESTPWFDNAVQKMVSIASAISSVTFTQNSWKIWGSQVSPSGDDHVITKNAYFDARAFVLPESEVNNYFVWRQQDATRNSKSTVAQSLYSHKELTGKNGNELQEMIFQKGQNWNDYPTHQRRGRCIIKVIDDKMGSERRRWIVDNEVPIFSTDPHYVNRHLVTEDELRQGD